MTSTPKFISGLELSRLFYMEAVKPILDAHFPELAYSAALIGPGSEVIGFDTPMSTDHDWGPRLLLFMGEADADAYRARIVEALAHELPYTFHGYSTHFGEPNLEDGGTQLLETIKSGPVNHRVKVYTIRAYFENYLRIDPYADIGPREWLTFSEQALLTVTKGAVYHDGLGELEAIRAKFAYYPRDVWLYLLASQWQHISQNEHLMGRCGYVGDEVGSALIAAQLVDDLMRLCFLMARQYAPYAKWYGTAFKQLGCAEALYPVFAAVLAADTWQERDRHLAQAYEHVMKMHNDLVITAPLDASVSPFWGRPFTVVYAERFSDAIREVIEDEAVKALTPHVGSVDQLSHATDLCASAERRERLKTLYDLGR